MKINIFDIRSSSSFSRISILMAAIILLLLPLMRPVLAAGPGKWGYINSSGIMVIAPRFDFASTFSDERAQVKTADGFGFIDTSGALVIPARYGQVMPFKHGVTSVRLFGGQEWFLINTRGERLGNQGFSEMLTFTDGLAAFRDKGKTGYVDTAGNIVIQPTLSWGGPFFNGRAPITLTLGYAFIDKSGAIAIKGPFQDTNPFSGGYALVKVKGMRGIIDTTGKWVIPPKYWALGPYSEGRASVQINRKWGYFDESGSIVIQPKYEFAATFKFGCTTVTLSGKTGLIDRSGTVVLPPVYESLEMLSPKCLRSVKDGVTQYITLRGEPFSSGDIGWLAPPAEGLHLYRGSNNKWGYISEDGTVVVEAQYCNAGAFGNGLAPVQVCE